MSFIDRALTGADRLLAGPTPARSSPAMAADGIPRALPYTSALVLLRYAELDAVPAVIDANGVGEVTFEIPAEELWLVDRMVVQSDSADATSAFVYAGEARPRNLRDGSDAGNLDVSDNNQPIFMPGGQLLRIQWTGGTAGAHVYASIQVRVMAQHNTVASR